MMISKSYKKVITREEYYKLMNLQNFHNMIMGILESIEEQALRITEEIDENDPEGKLLFGGYTGDSINSQDLKAIDDMLGLLGIEVEKDRVVENKKLAGKVSKKKFKSGQWAKNKELDKFIEVKDSPILHDYINDFSGINEDGIIKQSFPFMVGNIVDEKDGLFVSETWNHDGDELGDVVG